MHIRRVYRTLHLTLNPDPPLFRTIDLFSFSIHILILGIHLMLLHELISNIMSVMSTY